MKGDQHLASLPFAIPLALDSMRAIDADAHRRLSSWERDSCSRERIQDERQRERERERQGRSTDQTAPSLCPSCVRPVIPCHHKRQVRLSSRESRRRFSSASRIQCSRCRHRRSLFTPFRLPTLLAPRVQRRRLHSSVTSRVLWTGVPSSEEHVASRGRSVPLELSPAPVALTSSRCPCQGHLRRSLIPIPEDAVLYFRRRRSS